MQDDLATLVSALDQYGKRLRTQDEIGAWGSPAAVRQREQKARRSRAEFAKAMRAVDDLVEMAGDPDETDEDGRTVDVHPARAAMDAETANAEREKIAALSRKGRAFVNQMIAGGNLTAQQAAMWDRRIEAGKHAALMKITAAQTQTMQKALWAVGNGAGPRILLRDAVKAGASAIEVARMEAQLHRAGVL